MLDEATLQKLKEEKQKLEKGIYEASREAAIRRPTDGDELVQAAEIGFRNAISMVSSPDSLVAQFYLPVNGNCESASLFAAMCAFLTKLEAFKGKHYQASWCRRGWPGIFANIARKFDRIDAVAGGDSEAEETLTETLGDLAVYAIKALSWQAAVAPMEFDAWLKNIQSLGTEGSNDKKVG
jgi:hypothetical protein